MGKWKMSARGFRLRIIGGEFRSRQILAPKSDATRPITDRAKQSLFDVLGGGNRGARGLRLLRGNGEHGVGVSEPRGGHVTFFEADRSAGHCCGRTSRRWACAIGRTVVDRDIFKWFENAEPAGKVSLVFLDPPYRFLTERRTTCAGW